MSTEVRVPTLGESVTEATVATWFKQPGESVAVVGLKQSFTGETHRS